MTVKENLAVLAEHWTDEVFDMYQSCYRGSMSWNEYCNYVIETGFDAMTKLRNYEWEE